MERTLEQRAEIFVEDCLAPAMAESLQAQTCQTTVVRIMRADWGFDRILSQYGLHIEVPIPDGGVREWGSKMFLFQDARKIRQLLSRFGAADAAELKGKQAVVYFDPRFNNYSNPIGLSAPHELERYVTGNHQ